MIILKILASQLFEKVTYLINKFNYYVSCVDFEEAELDDQLVKNMIDNRERLVKIRDNTSDISRLVHITDSDKSFIMNCEALESKVKNTIKFK